ncbi:hypothetical protein C8R44DRAFT_804561, partial [Mycena epipterygia]
TPTSPPTSDMESTNNPPNTGMGASGQWEFPPELEREIFETTALLYPRTIPKLLRVARRVLFWKTTTYRAYRIEPLLYTAIGIDVFDSIRGSGAEMLLARIATKGPEFFSNAVRHMLICSLDYTVSNDQPWFGKDLETVFRICTGVDHLLLLADLGKPPLLQMLAATDMRPKSVYLMVVDLLHPQLDFAYPLFRKVSHLAVAGFSHPQPMHENWRHWSTICRLPSLTHLALGSSASPNLVHAIFTGAPHLEVLIGCVDAHTAALFSEELVLHDVRLVLGGLDRIELRFHTWSHSLDELWTQAEEFVSRKRSGQIRVSDYYLTPSQSPAQANVQVKSDSGSSAV